MNDFEKLLTRVRACQICTAHLPLGPRPVVRLTPHIKILIIAQAPGTKVHASGLPFDDLSGDRLRGWLGLNREQFYDESRIGFMPMGFCYPGKSRGGDNPPRPECAPAWHDKLRTHLKDVELTLLIGRYAIEKYWPEAKGHTLTEIVKSWKGGDVVPLVHPSPRNKLWLKKNAWFEGDVVPRVRERVKTILG